MTSFDIRDETIFSLLKAQPARPPAYGVWIWLFVLALTGWIGAVAFIGQYRRHEVVDVLYRIAGPTALYMGAVGVGLMLFVGALAAKRRNLAGAALVVTAFLLGHQVYAWLYAHLPARFEMPFRSNMDALQFAAGRLVYGLALVITMLAAWLLIFRRDGWPPLRLGLGNLRAVGRDVSRSAPPVPWGPQLVRGYGIFGVVLFLIMQANVAFKPILTGALWPLLPGILAAALANAIAEEYIFRGLIQPAFLRVGLISAGLWMQGLMFGLMHWGMSIGVLAALPVSLLIGLGSVVWGKAALDTGGLGWVIAAHAMVDVAVMSAFFVPST